MCPSDASENIYSCPRGDGGHRAEDLNAVEEIVFWVLLLTNVYYLCPTAKRSEETPEKGTPGSIP